MFKVNPLLMIDFYKSTHRRQYPPNVVFITSYYVPRMTRIKNNMVSAFGVQYFCQKFLVDIFNEWFFNQPREEICRGYCRILDHTIGPKAYSPESVEELYDLGYLPISISTVPEGMRVPIKVPTVKIENTDPRFPWLTNTIESLFSAEFWDANIWATIGYDYRQIVDKYYALTVDDDVPKARALGDFSFRGEHGFESACKCSAAFCLSFLNTATVSAIPWLEYYYDCDCTKEPVGFGAISTEHSVMCSNYFVDGNEKAFIRRALTELYPDQNFSCVMDSYDYWNVVDNILPKLKKEIMEHNGCLSVRGDSGDPVEVVTETVEHLWKTFGGTINSKGYKVLDPHVKAIYGDSITLQRSEKIYQILMDKGFAANCVSLGVGSFSTLCIEEEDNVTVTLEDGSEVTGIATMLKPFTRDTFGAAIKATYCQLDDGTEVPIFKNPKTDTGHFKKSHRGLCYVYRDENGDITYKDNLTKKDFENMTQEERAANLLQEVFRDGQFIKRWTLQEVRENLHGKGNF